MSAARLHPACTAEAFERRYRASPDPWQFERSAYELNRYELLLRRLTRTHYGRIFEPGCSIGILTQKLAARCDALLATDVAPTALAQARSRCAGLSHVTFAQSDLAATATGAKNRFDLIVFSEIGYYFTRERLASIAAGLAHSLSRRGELLAAHWLGESADHVLHGDDVHSILMQALPLRHTASERHSGFRIDSWVNDA